MRDYSDRIFASHGRTLGSIDIGGHTVGINGTGHKVFGMLDNRRLTESKSSKEFLSKASPVLGMVMSNLIPSDEVIHISARKSSNDSMLEAILDSIRKDKENAKIYVLEIKSDEMTENAPKDVQAASKEDTVTSMSKYTEELKSFESTLDETRKMAGILLRTTLPSTMWGGKEVGHVLSSVKADIDSMDNDLDHFEVLTENSVRASDYIMAALKSNLGKEEMDKIGFQKVARKLTDNFYLLKGTMSRFAQSLNGLFNIDRMFKKHTGYPTTWFFDSSIFYDFMYGYENLVNNLIKAISIEKGAIEPLFVWKVSTGEANVR